MQSYQHRKRSTHILKSRVVATLRVVRQGLGESERFGSALHSERHTRTLQAFQYHHVLVHTVPNLSGTKPLQYHELSRVGMTTLREGNMTRADWVKRARKQCC